MPYIAHALNWEGKKYPMLTENGVKDVKMERKVQKYPMLYQKVPCKVVTLYWQIWKYPKLLDTLYYQEKNDNIGHFADNKRYHHNNYGPWFKPILSNFSIFVKNLFTFQKVILRARISCCIFKPWNHHGASVFLTVLLLRFIILVCHHLWMTNWYQKTGFSLVKYEVGLNFLLV